MCLIAVKPKGTDLPKQKQLDDWFEGHLDGFGLAYPYGADKVRIRKGAMTKKAMHKLVTKMKQDLQEIGAKNVDVMFHFRQATNGEISPANCHPFPLTKNQEELAATELDTKYALAHNGIVGNSLTAYYSESYFCYLASTPGKTDTQEFIEDYLVDLGEAIHLPAVQALIVAYSESKFALMTPTGVEYIGKFIKEAGWYYSNPGYKLLPAVVSYTDADFPSRHKHQCCVCEELSDELYEIPNDCDLVCKACFIYFVGREPQVEEEEGYVYGGEQWF